MGMLLLTVNCELLIAYEIYILFNQLLKTVHVDKNGVIMNESTDKG